ncbi:hypothetical protein GCM10010149_47840 [Nonomuraea roseoviolacea subsp. roseoviolacea]
MGPRPHSRIPRQDRMGRRYTRVREGLVMDHHMPDQLDRDPEPNPLMGCFALIGVMTIAALALVGLWHLIF